jgi:hypothetical protein
VCMWRHCDRLIRCQWILSTACRITKLKKRPGRDKGTRDVERLKNKWMVVGTERPLTYLIFKCTEFVIYNDHSCKHWCTTLIWVK